MPVRSGRSVLLNKKEGSNIGSSLDLDNCFTRAALNLFAFHNQSAPMSSANIKFHTFGSNALWMGLRQALMRAPLTWPPVSASKEALLREFQERRRPPRRASFPRETGPAPRRRRQGARNSPKHPAEVESAHAYIRYTVYRTPEPNRTEPNEPNHDRM